MTDQVTRFKNLKAKFPNGASAIKCCYAARGIRVSSTMTEIVKWANASMIFSNAAGSIAVDDKRPSQ
jgi:hypothetical protein